MIIELPDGTELDAPDGLSPAQIKSIVWKHTRGSFASAGTGEAQAPPSPPKPGMGASFARGAGQGLTLGFLDEAAGGLAAALPFLDPEAAKGETVGERYRNARDFYRARNKAAQEANPKTFVAGSVAGALPTALTTGGAVAGKGASLGARMLAGARAAAPAGAVYGAGASEADSLGGVASDAAAGGAGAALLGGAAPAAGEAIRRVAQPVARRLSAAAIEQGRKALSGIGTPLAARKPIPEAAVQQALDTGAIRPLGTVAGTAARLETGAEAVGQEYAAILAELEKQGVTGPNAVLLARDIAAKAQEAARTSLGSARPKILLDASAELPTKVNQAPFAPKRLGLMQAEKIKRQLQFEAKREYDKIARQYTTSGETKKELASYMRQAIEDAVQAQAAKAPEAAAAFQPVKARLANTLEALRVAEEGAARAARRKPVSLTSTIAGSAAGAASGSPILGLLTAIGHGVVDARLASTLATAANAGAKGANALARFTAPPSATQAAAVGLDPELEALLSVLRGRPGLVPAGAEEDR